MSLSLILVILSGIAWTIVYIDSIRVGFKFKTYAMPFWALAFNIAWEFIHSILGFQEYGMIAQIIINCIWTLFDVVILYTFFKFGLNHFTKTISPIWFYWGAVAGIIVAFLIQYLFVLEFGLVHGATYSAFLQNLMMSILYIGMLIKRGSSKGQTLTIAISKWIGTMAPTILFGIIGLKSLGGPKLFVLIIGILIALVDIAYILMLAKKIKNEKQGLQLKPII